MTPEELAQVQLETCESCRQDMPILATLPFTRGKPRRVCINCLASAIQQATGFKMVNVLQRMLTARLSASAVSAAYREAAAALRAEMAGENGD